MSIPALIIAALVIIWIANALFDAPSELATLSNDLASVTLNLEADKQARELQILDDLELDHAVGRLSDEEFDSARAELSATHKPERQDY